MEQQQQLEYLSEDDSEQYQLILSQIQALLLKTPIALKVYDGNTFKFITCKLEVSGNINDIKLTAIHTKTNDIYEYNSLNNTMIYLIDPQDLAFYRGSKNVSELYKLLNFSLTLSDFMNLDSLESVYTRLYEAHELVKKNLKLINNNTECDFDNFNMYDYPQHNFETSHINDINSIEHELQMMEYSPLAAQNLINLIKKYNIPVFGLEFLKKYKDTDFETLISYLASIHNMFQYLWYYYAINNEQIIYDCLKLNYVLHENEIINFFHNSTNSTYHETIIKLFDFIRDCNNNRIPMSYLSENALKCFVEGNININHIGDNLYNICDMMYLSTDMWQISVLINKLLTSETDNNGFNYNFFFRKFENILSDWNKFEQSYCYPRKKFFSNLLSITVKYNLMIYRDEIINFIKETDELIPLIPYITKINENLTNNQEPNLMDDSSLKQNLM